MAMERHCTAILNAAPAQAGLTTMLRQATWLVVNEVEAEQLGACPVRDIPDAVTAATMLCVGSQRVVLTLGARGAVIVNDDGPLHVPALAVDVVDTTAAGDAFVGALGATLQRGASDRDAVHAAVVAGSLACTRTGALPSLPTAADVLARRT